MGSATLYQLARRGVKAIGEGAEYVPLVLRSHAI